MRLFKREKQIITEVIEQIHSEFSGACDVLLAEAKDVLEGSKMSEVEKGKRLSKLGFTNTRESKVSIAESGKIEDAEKQMELVMHYAVKYPAQKFITEDVVARICKKYNLVLGDNSRYKGFVPDKNLKEIEGFKGVEPSDMVSSKFKILDLTFMYKNMNAKGIKQIKEYLKLSGGYVEAPSEHDLMDILKPVGKYGKRDYTYISSIRAEEVRQDGLKICAPKKDMDTAGASLLGFKLSTITEPFETQFSYVPDPVVLQPVRGGYLILTMWGDEASDPELDTLNN